MEKLQSYVDDILNGKCEYIYDDVFYFVEENNDIIRIFNVNNTGILEEDYTCEVVPYIGY